VLGGAAILGSERVGRGWPWFGRRLVTWSSYIVLTEPIPDRLADLGWTGGEGVADARFTLHYLRTTPDGRIALGGGGGRPAFGGRDRRGVTDSLDDVRRAAAGLRRLFPSIADVRIEDGLGRPDRYHQRPSAVVRFRARQADPFRSRLQREWGRAVSGRGSDPRGAGGRGLRRSVARAGAGERWGSARLPA
jgi:hypothetical protein